MKEEGVSVVVEDPWLEMVTRVSTERSLKIEESVIG